LPKFVTLNVPNAYCGQPLLEHCEPLILLNLAKELSPEQLVTIKLKNKSLRGCIN